MVKVKEDLTGRVFERLTVLEQVEDYITPNGRHKAQWLCKCSCEENKLVIKQGDLLKNGHTRSCGCLSNESVINNNKTLKHKINQYNLNGEYGVGFTLNTNVEFYFDLEDYDKIKDYCWNEHILTNGYHSLEAWIPELKKHIRMHHLILNKYADHKDRNPLNNRKSNLRQATSAQNAQNHTKYKNNTSGITGVYFNKYHNCWIAEISVNKKRITIGRYQDKNDAIRARLMAEMEYHSEFASQQHLFEQYKININEEINND